MDTQELIDRIKARAKAEREIQRNNETVASALAPQLEAFERRDGSHNTYALRLMLDHQSCAKRDAQLAADWDDAASTLASQAAEIERLREALKPFAGEAERYDPPENDDEVKAFYTRFTCGDLRRARAALNGEKP